MATLVPIEGRAIVLEVGDGTTPTEVFTPICGAYVTAFNHTAQTSDRFLPDCSDRTKTPRRVPFVTGIQWDVTAGGAAELTNLVTIQNLVGITNNYRITVYEDDFTTEYGYYEGAFVMTACNLGGSQNDPANREITLASKGEITFTPA